MLNKSKKNVVLISLTIILLIIQVIHLIFTINDIQGNARVVNYAGIVRGATQRLIKNELYGKPQNSEIERLDNILYELQTGDGTQGLTVLNDTNYLTKLNSLAQDWEIIKETIYAAREDKSKQEELYTISEAYFISANDTVNAAEMYSDGIARKLYLLEITIVINIVIILVIAFIELALELQNNRKLSRIAYVDPNTGLPNKRACDEKLNNSMLIDKNQNVCCVMFDLNNLKTTNDTFGHEVGDALINSFASLLRRGMPSDMFVGRLGGDEFIGIQMNSDKETIIQKLEQMQNEANQTNIGENMSNICISFAYGYAFSNENTGCTIKTLMNIADKNMYYNKMQSKQNKR